MSASNNPTPSAEQLPSSARLLLSLRAEVEQLKTQLATAQERIAWFEKSGGVVAHTRVFEEMHKREAAEAQLAERRHAEELVDRIVASQRDTIAQLEAQLAALRATHERVLSILLQGGGYYMVSVSSERRISDAIVELRRAALSAPAQPTAEEPHSDAEAKLRYLLWCGHPCDGKYGDDGEMWCNRCVIDFKRYPVDLIERKIHERGLRMLAEAQAQPTHAKSAANPDYPYEHRCVECGEEWPCKASGEEPRQ